MRTKLLACLATVGGALAAAPPLPPATCAQALYQACWKHKASAATCAACELASQAALKRAGCSTEAEAAFCALPSSQCGAALALTCGLAVFENTTQCRQCVKGNAKGALKPCEKLTTDFFCDTGALLPHLPPINASTNAALKCGVKLLQACGDTVSDTDACTDCEQENGAELGAANCTPDVLTDFCTLPSVVPPGAQCAMQLITDCNHTIGDVTACTTCEREHQTGLDAANCTAAELAGFCEVPGRECARALALTCGLTAFENLTECQRCTADNAAALSSCSAPVVKGFCVASSRYLPSLPPLPPAVPAAAKCVAQLLPLCNRTIGDPAACAACEAAHKAVADAANCTAEALAGFCEGASCLAQLALTCGSALNNSAVNPAPCRACTAQHAGDALANCSQQALDEFCKIPLPVLPPLPHVVPGTECILTLAPACSHAVGDAAACRACEQGNDTVLAKCSAAELASFCAVPGEKCVEAFTLACGQTKTGSVEQCEACVAKKQAKLAAAGCTAGQETFFCQTTLPPTPPASSRYHCHDDTKVCAKSMMGEYNTMDKCQAGCRSAPPGPAPAPPAPPAPPALYDCQGKKCVAAASGQTKSDCEAVCGSFECKKKTQTCVKKVLGKYDSIGECQEACTSTPAPPAPPVPPTPAQMFTCQDKKCVAAASGLPKSDCKAACGSFKCKKKTQTCVKDALGKYNSVGECQDACTAAPPAPAPPAPAPPAPVPPAPVPPAPAPPAPVQLYDCVDNKCVAGTHATKAECEAACGETA